MTPLSGEETGGPRSWLRHEWRSVAIALALARQHSSDTHYVEKEVRVVLEDACVMEQDDLYNPPTGPKDTRNVHAVVQDIPEVQVVMNTGLAEPARDLRSTVRQRRF